MQTTTSPNSSYQTSSAEITHRLALKKTTTFQLLDACRGIAALAVAMYHSSLIIVAKQPNGQSNILFELCSFGFLGVQIFFVISGYCIAASASSILSKNKRLVDFVKARIYRIYPACWASLLLIIGFQVLARYLTSHGVIRESASASRAEVAYDWLFWLSNLTLTQILAKRSFISIVCWTLCYEVAFYGIVAAAISFKRPLGGWNGILWAIHGVTCISLVVLTISPATAPFPFDLWPQFGLGVLVFDFVNSEYQSRCRSCGTIMLFLIAILLLRSDFLLSIMQTSARLTYGASVVFALIIATLKPYDALICRVQPVTWARRIGYVSYSLYLTHYLVLGVVNQAFNRFPKGTTIQYFQFATSIIATIGVGWLFFIAAERPFLKAKS